MEDYAKEVYTMESGASQIRLDIDQKCARVELRPDLKEVEKMAPISEQ